MCALRGKSFSLVARGLFLAALCLVFLPAWAARSPETGSDLEGLAFFRPELTLTGSSQHLGAIQGLLANEQQWQEFLSRYGGEGEVYIDPRSGVPTNIMAPIALVPGDGYGNELTFQQLSGDLDREVTGVDEDLVGDTLLAFIYENQEVLSVDVSQLGEVVAAKVTENLWQVHLPQVVEGVPVRYSRLTATVSHGNLVLLGGEVWGNVQIDPRPRLSPEEAMRAGFEYLGGRLSADSIVASPALEILPTAPPEHEGSAGYNGPVGAGYGHLLVYSFAFERKGTEGTWQLAVDAHDGSVVELQDVNHYVTRRITGGVYPQSSTDQCPVTTYNLFDHNRCGVMQGGYPMPGADTGQAAPNDFTTTSGQYNYISGVSTTTLSGLSSNLNDICGPISESSTNGNILLGGVTGQHDCTTPVGAASAGNTSASRTVFHDTTKINEVARGWLPANAWLQTAIPTNVNLGSSCNAFYSPFAGSINFYTSGTLSTPLGPLVCRNTGEITAVTDHEWGHALDDNDAAGVLSNTSEGYADIATIYKTHSSCIGYGFWDTGSAGALGCGLTADGTGANTNEVGLSATNFHCATDCSGVREADWGSHVGGVPDTPQNFVCPQCGSGPGPCGRQSHCSGEPIRQAGWDLVARDLQASPFFLDRNNAFIVGNKLFYQGSGNVSQWYSCSCGAGTSAGCGAANGYMQWLAADDDNGNINDGTPHMTAIHAAFDRHNIACGTPAPFNTGCFAGPTAAPQVRVKPGPSSISLSWNAIAGATKYWVLRGEGINGCDSGKAIIGTVNSPSTGFTDKDVLSGHQYCYSVVAVGATDSCFGPASVCACSTPARCLGNPSEALLKEKFTSGIPATWTVLDGGSGGGASSTWNTNNPCGLSIGAPFSSPWAESNSQCAGLGASQDEQLITPRLDIRGCTQVFLDFSNQFAWNAAGNAEIADVDVSTDGGSTWFNVLRLENHNQGFPVPESRSIDLTPHTQRQKKLDVRFHYYNASGDGWWAVDNVSVSCRCRQDADSSDAPFPFPAP